MKKKKEPAVLFTPETPIGFLCQMQDRPFPMLRPGVGQGPVEPSARLLARDFRN